MTIIRAAYGHKIRHCSRLDSIRIPPLPAALGCQAPEAGSTPLLDARRDGRPLARLGPAPHAAAAAACPAPAEHHPSEHAREQNRRPVLRQRIHAVLLSSISLPVHARGPCTHEATLRVTSSGKSSGRRRLTFQQLEALSWRSL